MATTYTPALRLSKPASGDLVGTWGTTVNNEVTTLIEQALTGNTEVAITSGVDYTLTANDGATDEARKAVLNCTGALSVAGVVICPAANKLYAVLNNTTGGYKVTVKTAAGTGVDVQPGATALVYCDGTDVLPILFGAQAVPTVGGTPMTADEVTAALENAARQDYVVSCSDLVSSLQVGTSVAYFRTVSAVTVYEVRASLLTASSSGPVTVNIKKNGVTILSTLLTIDQGERTSETAATPAVISVPAGADDDLYTIDITTAGVGAKGLSVTVMARIA